MRGEEIEVGEAPLGNMLAVLAMLGESRLHCETNEILRRHIEGDDPINLAEFIWGCESLVELIVLGRRLV
jgi:hypothetical protein